MPRTARPYTFIAANVSTNTITSQYSIILNPRQKELSVRAVL